MTGYTTIARRLAGANPSHQDLPPVSGLPDLVRKLRVEQRARHDAMGNLPAADATAPGASERAIEDFHRKVLATMNVWVMRGHAAIEQQLDALREPQGVPQLEACRAHLEQGLESLRLSATPALAEARARERRSERELRAFKDANALEREAHQPDSIYLHVALLVFVLLVEGVVNAWSFGVASWHGWVGGLQQALVVAAINLAVAFAAGLAVREIIHVSSWRKAIGATVALLYACFLGAYTLLIGHYRAALQYRPDEAVTAAIEQMRAAPFAVADVYTVLLMIASVAFAAVAIITALKILDPYPGFSAVDRRHRAARRGLQALRDHYLARVNALFQEQEQRLEQVLVQARQARSSAGQTLEAARHLAEQYRHGTDAIAGSCRASLGQYRATNLAVRTAPPPTYFDDEWPDFAARELAETGSPAIETARTESARQRANPGELEASAAAIKKQLNDRHTECLREVPAFYEAADALAEPVPTAPGRPPTATAKAPADDDSDTPPRLAIAR
ncbi:MAG: hypothetical protein EOM91_11235 [Sphingobacteriia bacterium]|nr:hypothetical protein [Sphingobacteriia bacterium]NCC40647.1 hypothetical protein [Gammaproteobacteria bacterium]